jgi:hypothetical protein
MQMQCCLGDVTKHKHESIPLLNRFPQLRWSKRHPGKYRWVLYEMWPLVDPITHQRAVLVCEQNISQVGGDMGHRADATCTQQLVMPCAMMRGQSSGSYFSSAC